MKFPFVKKVKKRKSSRVGWWTGGGAVRLDRYYMNISFGLGVKKQQRREKQWIVTVRATGKKGSVRGKKGGRCTNMNHPLLTPKNHQQVATPVTHMCERGSPPKSQLGSATGRGDGASPSLDALLQAPILLTFASVLQGESKDANGNPGNARLRRHFSAFPGVRTEVQPTTNAPEIWVVVPPYCRRPVLPSAFRFFPFSIIPHSQSPPPPTV